MAEIYFALLVSISGIKRLQVIPLKGFVRLMMLKNLMRCFSLDVLQTIFALLLFVEHNGGVLDLQS